jgi:SAM-dependent methyltransferase
MKEKNNGKPAKSPAEIYEESFVPALFRQWGEIITDVAGVDEGKHVLDVACGTGVAAIAAENRVGSAGRVVGLDINEEMLAVARRKNERIDWRQGEAESLPFADNFFDIVVSQFGFMFFEDKVAALREMQRVLRPGGRMVVAVCDALDHSPGYAVLAELLHRLFGGEVAQSFRAPFSCGDTDMLRTIAIDAGIRNCTLTRHDGQVCFHSIESLVATEKACVWTLGGLLDDEQFKRLKDKAQESLKPFAIANGEVSFLMPVLMLSADKV